jgi:hypothetical protein
MSDAQLKRVENALNAIVENLAHIEHERWSHWQTYMHSMGVRQADGSLLISRDLVDRWDRQRSTPYAELSEREKESDREQVRKYMPLLLSTLSKN